MNSLRTIQFVIRDPLASLRGTPFAPIPSTPPIELLPGLLVMSTRVSKVCLEERRERRPRVSTSSQGSSVLQVWLLAVLERELAHDRP